MPGMKAGKQKIVDRNRTHSQDDQLSIADVDDRAFESHITTWLTHDGIDSSVKVFEHGLPCGTTGSSRTIRAGSCDRYIGQPQEFECNRVRWDSDCHGIEPRRDGWRNLRLFLKNDRERSWRESLKEFVG